MHVLKIHKMMMRKHDQHDGRQNWVSSYDLKSVDRNFAAYKEPVIKKKLIIPEEDSVGSLPYPHSQPLSLFPVSTKEPGKAKAPPSSLGYGLGWPQHIALARGLLGKPLLSWLNWQRQLDYLFPSFLPQTPKRWLELQQLFLTKGKEGPREPQRCQPHCIAELLVQHQPLPISRCFIMK